MKVIVDNKIPYIKEAVGQIADEVVYLPGAAFTPRDVKDADALIIRTRTCCNRELLEGSSVKFIATATIGFDHIDVDYCREAGIAWSNCPGCNAGGVEQYVHAALLLLKRLRGMKPEDTCMGIVGVGHVGIRIRRMAEALGMNVLLNAPPREDNGEQGFTDLQTVIINTCRGEVIDTPALLSALKTGQISDAIIDTWEHEPDIDRELLQAVFLGTPHIAGYSADGKANATRMALEAVCRFFHIDASFKIVSPDMPPMTLSADKEEAFLQVYNPQRDSDWLKQRPEEFEQFRGNYPVRRELL